MNRLRSFLLFIALSGCIVSDAQQGYLFVKKGFHKKRTYTEGDAIYLKLEDGSLRAGVITLLRNDTIFINGKPVDIASVSQLILEKQSRKNLPDIKTLLLIGAGTAITTAALTISKQATFEQALTAGLVIGYGPLVIRYLGGTVVYVFKRKKFKIGKKFRLQVLDFHLSPGPLRSF